MIAAVLLAQALLVEGSATAAEVMLDRRDSGLWYISVVDPSIVNASGLYALYVKLTSNTRPKPYVVILSAFADKPSAYLALGGKGHTEADYADVMQEIKAARTLGPYRLSRLMAIGDDIVVQKADGDRISRHVLRGTDPTQLTAGAWTGELLEIYFHRLPRSIRPDGMNPLLLDGYIMAYTEPTEAEVVQIAQGLRNETHEQELELRLHIRLDAWFMFDLGFPLWYPFIQPMSPPSFAEYTSRPESYCVSEGPRMRCSHVRYPSR